MDTSFGNIYRILTIITSFILLLLVAVAAKHQLVWIATAFFLAVALNPAVDFFKRYVTGRRRGLAIGLTFLSMIIVLAAIIATLTPPLVRQSRSLVNNLPTYTNKLVTSNDILGKTIRKYDLVNRVKSDQAQLLRQVTSFGGSFFTVLRSIFSSLAATITVLGLTFFMLLEGPDWINQAWQRYHSPKKKRYQELVQQMYHSVTGYVNGNILTSIIAAVAAAIALLIVGIPYAAPLAIFVGVMDLVPLIGASVGAVAVVLVALFHSPASAIIMAIFFLAYQGTENHVLTPIIYGRTVKISPLLVLIAVLIGAGLGGLLGGLVSIPVAASIQIVVKEYLLTRGQRSV